MCLCIWVCARLKNGTREWMRTCTYMSGNVFLCVISEMIKLLTKINKKTKTLSKIENNIHRRHDC